MALVVETDEGEGEERSEGAAEVGGAPADNGARGEG